VAKKGRMNAGPGVLGDALAQVTPDALVSVLVPTLDEVSKRVHGVIEHAEDAGRGLVDNAALQAGRVGADVEKRARRVGERLGDEARDVVSDANVKVAQNITRAKKGAESVLDSFMDRVLALALAVAIAYGAYFIASSRGGPVNLSRIALLVWMGMTFFSAVIGLAWRFAGRPERLKHTMVWFLYISALGGIGTVVLLVISMVPNF
jgi:hypothetical protein